MNNLIVKGLIAWFNDGKRLTALALIVIQMGARWLSAKGYPVPPELADSMAGYVAAAVLTGLSKADVKVPVAPAPPTP